MKTVKVVFTRTKGFFPWCIRLVTRSYFNHVYIVYPNNHILEADKREGVVIRPESEIKGEIEDDVQLSFNVEDKQFAMASLYGVKRCGRKYDWRGIVGCLVNNDKLYNPEKYYCSRLVRDWLFIAGVIKDPYLVNINPQQLFSMLLKQKGNH